MMVAEYFIAVVIVALWLYYLMQGRASTDKRSTLDKMIEMDVFEAKKILEKAQGFSSVTTSGVIYHGTKGSRVSEIIAASGLLPMFVKNDDTEKYGNVIIDPRTGEYYNPIVGPDNLWYDNVRYAHMISGNQEAIQHCLLALSSLKRQKT